MTHTTPLSMTAILPGPGARQGRGSAPPRSGLQAVIRAFAPRSRAAMGQWGRTDRGED